MNTESVKKTKLSAAEPGAISSFIAPSVPGSQIVYLHRLTFRQSNPQAWDRFLDYLADQISDAILKELSANPVPEKRSE